MSFAQSQIMGKRRKSRAGTPSNMLTDSFVFTEGASPSIVLAYYPSPAPSPRDRSESFGLSMTPMPSAQISPPLSSMKNLDAMNGSALSTSPPKENFVPPTRKRLTPRKAEEPKAEEPVQEKAQVAKIGNKEEVKITGRRIRCKMCR